MSKPTANKPAEPTYRNDLGKRTVELKTRIEIGRARIEKLDRQIQDTLATAAKSETLVDIGPLNQSRMSLTNDLLSDKKALDDLSDEKRKLSSNDVGTVLRKTDSDR
jgi:hypothetical protein